MFAVFATSKAKTYSKT